MRCGSAEGAVFSLAHSLKHLLANYPSAPYSTDNTGAALSLRAGHVYRG